jgi:site-specific recombinase XerD
VDEKVKLLLQRYKNHLCGEYNSRNTQADYYCHAKQFLKITNNKLNKNTITRYKAFLNQKYKNKNTRNKKIIATNMFLDWMGKSYLRMKNIGWEHPVKPTLKDEEIIKLLDTAYNNPELYLITLLLWEGCLRDETIINLKLTDRIDNKLYIEYSKTGNKSIILSQRMIEAWDNYLQVRTKPKPEYKEYLLINPYTGHKGEKFQRILPIIKRIKKLGKKCGIKLDITPFTIRRTSGTLRQDKFSEFFAGDVKIVQRMFNHKDVRTTLRYDQRTDYDVERYLESIYNSDQAKYKPKETAYKEGL